MLCPLQGLAKQYSHVPETLPREGNVSDSTEDLVSVNRGCPHCHQLAQVSRLPAQATHVFGEACS